MECLLYNLLRLTFNLSKQSSKPYFSYTLSQTCNPSIYSVSIWALHLLVHLLCKQKAGKGNIILLTLKVKSSNIPKRGTLPGPVAHFSRDQQRLLVVVERLRLLAQSIIDAAQIVECGALSGAVTHFSAEQQRLLVVVERLRLLAQSIIDAAQVVERGALSGAVTH